MIRVIMSHHGVGLGCGHGGGILHLVSGGYQINLFEDTEEQIRLYDAMDHIRQCFGDRAVIRASGMHARTIGRMMNPFSGQPPSLLANRRQ